MLLGPRTCRGVVAAEAPEAEKNKRAQGDRLWAPRTGGLLNSPTAPGSEGTLHQEGPDVAVQDSACFTEPLTRPL